MTQSNPHQIDPRFDLVLERIIDVPRELVWAAWTTPEHVKKWFTPAPWKTVECEIDLRPGGIFRTVMRSPDKQESATNGCDDSNPPGTEFPNVGCFLEVVPLQKLVWTDALQPGFRPSKNCTNPMNGFFTAIIQLESHGKGTKYTAIAIHKDEETCRKHEQMGFHQGWGAALNQLVALVKTM